MIHTGSDPQCYPIRFSCSLFAFLGLLFNSISAAITFSKLERVLTKASISFCSTACLQFGKSLRYTRGGQADGVHGRFWMKNNSLKCLPDYSSESSEDSGDSGNSRHEDAARKLRTRHTDIFPFLEFRLVNDHANRKNRPVLNARVNASEFRYLH